MFVSLALLTTAAFVLIGGEDVQAKDINTTSYDKITRTMLISDSLAKDTVKLTLQTPLNNHVARGPVRFAEYENYAIEEVKIFISEIELRDRNDGMKPIEREIWFKVKTIVQGDIEEYSEVCEEVYKENKTIVCVHKLTGTHIGDVIEWLPLEKVNFEKGEKITIGLYTDVQKGDSIEWIPTFMINDKDEIRITEWAVWTEGLNTGLVFYYRCDENAGVAVGDAVTGAYDETFIGSPGWETGKLGVSSCDFDATGDYINPFTILNDTWTLSYWVYPVTVSGSTFTYIRLNKESVATTGAKVVQFYLHTGAWQVITSNKSLTQGAWNHIIYSFDNTPNLGIGYINGDLAMVNTFPNGWSNSGLTMYIPRHNVWTDGWIDEWAVWNRTITASEASDLWNGGTGINYTTIFPPEDSCTYDVGDWNITMSDYCVLSTDTDIGANDLLLYKAGNATINATIEVANSEAPDNNAIMYIESEGRLIIG